MNEPFKLMLYMKILVYLTRFWAIEVLRSNNTYSEGELKPQQVKQFKNKFAVARCISNVLKNLHICLVFRISSSTWVTPR